MTVFASVRPVIAGVDEVLRVLTIEAVKDVAPPVGVAVGPLDRPANGPRLNWFLYSALPYAAPIPKPPPVSLDLHYLLTADAGELSDDGTEDDVVHAALTAAVSALAETPVLSRSTRVASGPDRTVADVTTAFDTLSAPLRISFEQLPVETIAALWSTGSRAMRLSVGYVVTVEIGPA